MGEVACIKRGASPRPINQFITKNKNGVNWIKIGDTDEGKYVHSTKQKITLEGAKRSVYLSKGNLILSNSMSFGRPYILGIDGCIHDGWLAITVSDYFNKDFMYYTLLASTWYFEQKATGTTVRNLSINRVVTLPIPLPPLSEQTLIVERIESLFNKLNRVKEIIENLQNKFPLRKAAILGRAFRGELTATWREKNKDVIAGLNPQSHDTRTNLHHDNVAMHSIPKEEQPYDIPESWVWVRGAFCLLPMTKKKPTGKFFRYIDIDAINNKLQKVSEPKELPISKAPSRASREVCEGDTLFSMVRPYLKNIAYINFDLANCIASTGFFVCRPNKTLNSHYLYYLMISSYMVDGLNFYMRGDNSPSIRPKNIYNFPFPLPPLAEQEEIVRRLDSIFEKEEKTKKLCNMIEKIELMKKAILAHAFRGELTG